VYCVEVEGIEWDWFASDLAGHVALVSSGGSGQVPPTMIEHERLIHEFKNLAGIQCDERSWKVAADFGLYGYDVDVNGGPYVRLGTPSCPKCIDDLPERFRALVRQVVVQGSFDRMQTIKCDQFNY
jgi:hypothetical protein